MTKICGACKAEKPLTDFNKNKACKDGYHGDCRQCKKEYQARWYATHADEQKARTAKWKLENYPELVLWYQELKNYPCADCKQSYPPYVMDFDHLPEFEKRKPVSALLGSGKEAVLQEIKKCELVCANCHRIRTHTRKGFVAEGISN